MKTLLNRIFKRSRQQPKFFRFYLAYYNNDVERDFAARHLYRNHSTRDR